MYHLQTSCLLYHPYILQMFCGFVPYRKMELVAFEGLVPYIMFVFHIFIYNMTIIENTFHLLVLYLFPANQLYIRTLEHAESKICLFVLHTIAILNTLCFIYTHPILYQPTRGGTVRCQPTSANREHSFHDSLL